MRSACQNPMDLAAANPSQKDMLNLAKLRNQK
jgi:hypothetical protein